MIGRDRELAVGRAALDAAARGRGGALLILGDAGMGKTRLIDALLEDAQARGWHTLRGTAREEEGRAPYGAIIEAIDPLIEARPDLLESLNESSGRALALLSASAPGPREHVERHQVFAAVGQLVGAARAVRFWRWRICMPPTWRRFCLPTTLPARPASSRC